MMKILVAHRNLNPWRANRPLLMVVLALTVMALIPSCNKIYGPDSWNDGWNKLGGDRPVLFYSNLAEPSTKATLPDNTTFGVFAFYQPGTLGTPGSWNPSTCTPNFMFNQSVLFRETDSYTYSPIRYWPSNDYNTLSFWAYCPYNPTDDNIAFIQSGSTYASYISTTTGFPDIEYTVDTGKTDLLIATPVTNLAKPANDDPVSFSFHHTLSKINFKFKKADGTGNEYTIKVLSISFQNVYLTGFHGSSHWRDLSNASSVLYPFEAYSGSPEISAASSAPETPAFSTILIPQDVESNSAVIHLEYSVQLNSDPEEVFEGDCLLTGEWLEGKQYTYTISISPGNPIIFSASITDWDPNVENGYVYIVN